MILQRKLAARVAFVALTSIVLSSSSPPQAMLVAAAAAAVARPGGGHGGSGGGGGSEDGLANKRIADASEDAPSVTARPKTGCPYLRSLQAASETITQADLAPLRGVDASVTRLFFSAAPKKAQQPASATDAKQNLDLDAISKQRKGGSIEHPGSLGCSPEFVVDGVVAPPRRDPRRLPLLLSLLGRGDADEPRPLTAGDVARASRLALAMDEQFFAAKYGSAAAMDASALLKNVVPTGESLLAVLHLRDDAGLVKQDDLLALVHEARLSAAPEPAGGKVGVPALAARLTRALAARAAMPWADRQYRAAAEALERMAADAGGSVMDLETGLVRGDL